MNPNSKWNPLVSCKKKVMPFSAFTFFLCLISIVETRAADNSVDGTAYGTDSSIWNQAGSINSISNGVGDVYVSYTGTTNLTFEHLINGSISITNGFDRFTLTGTSGTLSNATFAALRVVGGTNLYIKGGQYQGVHYDSGVALPPIPGQPPQTNTISVAAMGGFLIRTEKVKITDAQFSAGTLNPDNAKSIGLSGLEVYSSSLMITGSNSLFTGASAKSTSGSGTTDVNSFGGTALYAENSSVVISNGIFKGGDSGKVTATGAGTAISMGGNAVNVWSNSTLEITGGSFTGGNADAADASENNSLSLGGYAIVLGNSSTGTIHGGTFKGGSSVASVGVIDSMLTVNGGSLSSGIFSQTTDAGTNILIVSGGTISSIEMLNNQLGHQNLTVSSNANVSGSISLFGGGTAALNNEIGSNLQQLSVYEGILSLSNGIYLGSSGSIELASASSLLTIPQLDAQSGSDISTELGRLDITGSFSSGSDSTLNFDIVTNTWGTISAYTATFASNTIMNIDASAANFTAGTNYVTNIVTTSGIYIVGDSNKATSAMFTNNVKISTTLTQNTSTTGRTRFGQVDLTGGNLLVLQFDTQSLSEYWKATGQLALLGDDLDFINHPEMMQIIDNLGATQSEALVEETYLTTKNTFQVAKQGLDAAVGLSLSRGTEFREQLLLPKGSGGPPEGLENDWRFWAKYYGQFYHRNEDGLNPKYDAVMSGGVFGMDKSFGHLLIGLSGGLGRYTISTERDAEQEMSAYQGALYSTLGKGHAYLDAGLAYGFNAVESETTAPFSLTSKFDTQLVSAHLGGGYGFELPAIGTILTPEAAIRHTLYQQGAYKETGTAAIPRSFEKFDTDSLAGTLGLNAAMLNSTSLKTFSFKLEGRAHWIHEFNPEPGDISYQLVGGSNDYIISYPSLDEDTIRLGVGFTFYNTKRGAIKNVLLRLDFDELFGEDFNSHNLSAKAIYAF